LTKKLLYTGELFEIMPVKAYKLKVIILISHVLPSSEERVRQILGRTG
jgi:hypothetical protein